VDFLSQIDFTFSSLLNINYIWNQVEILTHITEKKKTSVTSHTDICMKAAVSPVRKLLSVHSKFENKFIFNKYRK